MMMGRKTIFIFLGILLLAAPVFAESLVFVTEDLVFEKGKTKNLRFLVPETVSAINGEVTIEGATLANVTGVDTRKKAEWNPENNKWIVWGLNGHPVKGEISFWIICTASRVVFEMKMTAATPDAEEVKINDFSIKAWQYAGAQKISISR